MPSTIGMPHESASVSESDDIPPATEYSSFSPSSQPPESPLQELFNASFTRTSAPTSPEQRRVDEKKGPADSSDNRDGVVNECSDESKGASSIEDNAINEIEKLELAHLPNVPVQGIHKHPEVGEDC